MATILSWGEMEMTPAKQPPSITDTDLVAVISVQPEAEMEL